MRVEHQPDANRYALIDDEHGDEVVGVADYVIRGTTLAIVHTETDPTKRGQGLGSILVRGTLDDLRETTEYRVEPACSFVQAWIGSHPDYEPLTTR